MSTMGMEWEMIIAVIAAVITLAIFSYLLSDNLLYRWALALLVGSGTGFAFGAAMHYLLTWLQEGWRQTSVVGQVVYGIPVLLGLLLLFKSVPRLSPLGNISMGFVLGAGAALALVGALLGTLLPQVLATSLHANFTMTALINAAIVVVGVLTALFVFSPMPAYNAVEERSRPLILWLRRLGRGFIAVALAVAFAGALTTALTLMVERLWSLAALFSTLIPLLGG